MYHSTKTSSDHHHQEQPLSHHQLIRWPLKQPLLRPPQPKQLLPQHQELRHNPPQQGLHRQMYYRAYKERSEERFQEDLQEEEEEVEQDLQAAEHQHHPPMFPNNLRNLLKMLK